MKKIKNIYLHRLAESSRWIHSGSIEFEGMRDNDHPHFVNNEHGRFYISKMLGLSQIMDATVDAQLGMITTQIKGLINAAKSAENQQNEHFSRLFRSILANSTMNGLVRDSFTSIIRSIGQKYLHKKLTSDEKAEGMRLLKDLFDAFNDMDIPKNHRQFFQDYLTQLKQAMAHAITKAHQSILKNRSHFNFEIALFPIEDMVRTEISKYPDILRKLTNDNEALQNKVSDAIQKLIDGFLGSNESGNKIENNDPMTDFCNLILDAIKDAPLSEEDKSSITEDVNDINKSLNRLLNAMNRSVKDYLVQMEDSYNSSQELLVFNDEFFKEDGIKSPISPDDFFNLAGKIIKAKGEALPIRPEGVSEEFWNTAIDRAKIEVDPAEQQRVADAAAELAAREQAERDRLAAAAAADDAEQQRIADAAAAEPAARELAERTAAETAARELAERAAELAARELAERAAELAARELAERTAAEAAARELAERTAAELAARELAERTAAETAARELAERTAAETAARELAERDRLAAADPDVVYNKSLDAIKQQVSKRNPKELNDSISKFIAQIEYLKKNDKELIKDLITALDNTNKFLTGDKEMSSLVYTKYANSVQQGKASMGMKILGGLMIALSITVLILGLVFFPMLTSAAGASAAALSFALTATAAKVTAGVAVGGTTTLLSGFGGGFFVLGRATGLSKAISDVNDAQNKYESTAKPKE